MQHCFKEMIMPICFFIVEACHFSSYIVAVFDVLGIFAVQVSSSWWSPTEIEVHCFAWFFFLSSKHTCFNFYIDCFVLLTISVKVLRLAKLNIAKTTYTNCFFSFLHTVLWQIFLCKNVFKVSCLIFPMWTVNCHTLTR